MGFALKVFKRNNCIHLWNPFPLEISKCTKQPAEHQHDYPNVYPDRPPGRNSSANIFRSSRNYAFLCVQNCKSKYRRSIGNKNAACYALFSTPIDQLTLRVDHKGPRQLRKHKFKALYSCCLFWSQTGMYCIVWRFYYEFHPKLISLIPLVQQCSYFFPAMMVWFY